MFKKYIMYKRATKLLISYPIYLINLSTSYKDI